MQGRLRQGQAVAPSGGCTPPYADKTAVLPSGALPAVVLTAFLAADSARKAGAVGGQLPFLYQLTFGGAALIRPAVLLGCRYPSGADDATVCHVELQCQMLRHDDLLHLGAENFFVKGIKPKNLGALCFEGFLWNIPRRAFATFLFLCSAAVGGVFIALLHGNTFQPASAGIPHKTLSAVTALDFPCEAVDIEGFISEHTQVFSAFEFCLDCLPFVHRDDGFVGILNEILWQFATVLFPLLGDGIKAVFFVEEHIARVGNVGEDTFHIGIHPLTAFSCVNTTFHQCSADLDARCAFHVFSVHEADDFCLLRDDDQFVIHPLVAEDGELPVGDALLEPLYGTPFNVLGNTPAFFLGKGRKQGQHQLAVLRHGVDVFLFKLYGNA